MVEIRAINENEIVAFRQAVSAGFGMDGPTSDDAAEQFLSVSPLETTMAGFDAGHIIATFASYNLDLTVPGSTVAMAGTSAVTVSPTHRRRGLLTEMMARHLTKAIDLGQLVAGLWASEEQIYGRFGYGMAAEGLAVEVPGERLSLPTGPPDITVAPVTVEQARVELPPVYGRFCAATPGSFKRWDGWWEQRHFLDAPHRRPPGSTQRRHVVARRNGQAVGYSAYRQVPKLTDAGPGGVVSVVELIADDDDARRTLWRFLTTIDLYPNVEHWNMPVDDPMLIEADRFRLIKLTRKDTLWLRLLDVAAALQARSYERDGALTIEVTDRFLGRGGRFLLDVVGGSASCRAASTPPDVVLDIAELSSIYLGGRSAAAMARARLLDGTPGAIRQLDDLFAATAAPYVSEVF